jgi:aminoglycoside phosphotransferase family enzyme/predicted kinase
MQIDRLVNQLSRPSAYPHPVDGDIVVHQTHISVVFLAGDFAYKFKKPVDLGFLDYSTLEKRRHFCEREVELNRRLAPEIYLGTVPATVSGAHEGDFIIGGGGEGEAEPLEWAVKMVRLPDQATLEARLERDEVTAGQVESLARHLASFHARAERGDAVSRFARFEAVAKNARDNFEHSVDQIGETIHAEVFDRLSALNDAKLDELREVIERRAGDHVACDTHGDLRLDHVYLFDKDGLDGEFVIVDCIEFNDAFRFADPISDIAFLAMDLQFDDRRDLARALVAEYLEAADDREGAELLAFYVAYRAAVRAKVEGIKACEEEVGVAEREQARNKARAHWLLALGRLEVAERRPAMVLVGGLPGTGKSTLAAALAERANFEVIDTDIVRKELADLATHESGKAEYTQGIYTSEWSERTYLECLRRAEQLLFKGKRVIIDATFASEARRQMCLASGRAHGVRTLLLECETSAQTAKERLAARSEDVSDADCQVYRKMVAAWDEPSTSIQRARRVVSAEGEIDAVVERALEELRGAGLC